ncbi:hypothetical protein KI387_039644, partial [Taxus chinensis]
KWEARVGVYILGLAVGTDLVESASIVLDRRRLIVIGVDYNERRRFYQIDAD